MGSGLSMSSRAEITAKFDRGYVGAPKAGKGQILDQVVAVTGWSRDNARRRLRAAAAPPGAGRQVAKRICRQRNPKYS
ncbi:transposase [Mycobacterium shottsii]|nr:transposase [Mycobacterium shottsii]